MKMFSLKMTDFIDFGLVLLATKNGDSMDFYLDLLPVGVKVSPKDLDDYEKGADEVCWDSLLLFEKILVEKGLWG
jgi:hypothetical protein